MHTKIVFNSFGLNFKREKIYKDFKHILEFIRQKVCLKKLIQNLYIIRLV